MLLLIEQAISLNNTTVHVLSNRRLSRAILSKLDKTQMVLDLERLGFELTNELGLSRTQHREMYFSEILSDLHKEDVDGR